MDRDEVFWMLSARTNIEWLSIFTIVRGEVHFIPVLYIEEEDGISNFVRKLRDF